MKNLIRLILILALIFTNIKLFASSITEPGHLFNPNSTDQKNSSPSETMESETQILRLEFRVSSGASRSFVLGFTEDATDGYDYGYDGGLIQNPPPDDMGSLLNGQQYVIQAFAPITPDKELDLVLHASGDYTYTLISTEISYIPEDQDLFLRDNLTGEFYDLRDKDGYQFTSKAGTFMNRFQVIFQDPALSNEDFTEDKTVIYVNQNEGKLYVRDLFEKVAQLSLINMLGQTAVLYTGINNQTLENGINISDLNTGVYIVRIKTDNKISIDKKVIIN